MTTSHSAQFVVGRYALFDAVARGGMATVHIGRLAGAAGFSKTVAVKRMHENLATNPEFVAMFVDEAHLAGRIQHPNVVNVFDVFASDNEAFLVMEYVHGESLSTLLKRCRAADSRPPVAIAAQIVRGALYGLHAAHEATSGQGEPLHLVHRDVSPQNIMVGTDGVPRVFDFGIAKAVGRLQDSTTGQLKGKMSYMAPEQVLGQPVDRRVDVYAAGVVLWEALAGRKMRTGETSAEIVYGILEEQPPDLHSIVPDLDPRLSAAVVRATSREREQRFPTALAFAEELEKCAELLPANAVGAFVREYGGDKLVARENKVREIEAATLELDVDLPTRDELTSRPTGEVPLPGPVMVAGAADETFADVPVSRSQSNAQPVRPGRQRWLVVAAIGATVAAAAYLGASSLTTLAAPPTPSAVASELPTPTPAAEPSAAASAPAEPPAEPSASAPPGPKSAPSVAEPAPPPKPRPRPRPAKPPRAEDLFGRE